MTPDDLGYAKKDGSEKVEPRARQNVVLETGMLLALLTRARMSLLVTGVALRSPGHHPLQQDSLNIARPFDL